MLLGIIVYIVLYLPTNDLRFLRIHTSVKRGS